MSIMSSWVKLHCNPVLSASEKLRHVSTTHRTIEILVSASRVHAPRSQTISCNCISTKEIRLFENTAARANKLPSTIRLPFDVAPGLWSSDPGTVVLYSEATRTQFETAYPGCLGANIPAALTSLSKSHVCSLRFADVFAFLTSVIALPRRVRHNS